MARRCIISSYEMPPLTVRSANRIDAQLGIGSWDHGDHGVGQLEVSASCYAAENHQPHHPQCGRAARH